MLCSAYHGQVIPKHGAAHKQRQRIWPWKTAGFLADLIPNGRQRRDGLPTEVPMDMEMKQPDKNSPATATLEGRMDRLRFIKVVHAWPPQFL